MLLKQCIQQLMQGQDLKQDVCQAIMNDLLKPDTNSLQTAAFLTLLHAKQETTEELVGLVKGLQQTMLPLPVKHKVLDIVGTGGDNANTINISTGSALLAASSGIKVAKHGNRAVSSQAGSADVLAALGINIELTPEEIATSIDELNFGFCFAPNFHPAMQSLRQLRRELNVPTSFNVLGPLLNPAKPAHILLGVYSANYLDLMAACLQQLGTERSIIVHAHGLDELSCVGSAEIRVVTPNTIETFHLDPTRFGLTKCKLSDLQGGNANENASVLEAIFKGNISNQYQAIAETLIFNAAVALYLYGLHDTISDAVLHAKENLQSGKTFTLLQKLRELSHD